MERMEDVEAALTAPGEAGLARSAVSQSLLHLSGFLHALHALHGSSSWRAPDAPFRYRFSVILCTLQLVISPMSSSCSLRQSMELASPNSFGSFPAEPNRPTTLPSSCTL
jgi:hypothetical protein